MAATSSSRETCTAVHFGNDIGGPSHTKLISCA
jgi:hypothetical protein